MKELPPLDGLSHAEKDALIGGLWQELQTLRSEMEKLKQNRVKKTSRNSSWDIVKCGVSSTTFDLQGQARINASPLFLTLRFH